MLRVENRKYSEENTKLKKKIDKLEMQVEGY